MQELKKLVQVNKSTLVLVRGSLDQPEEMKKAASQLIDVQSLLQVNRFKSTLYKSFLPNLLSSSIKIENQFTFNANDCFHLDSALQLLETI